MDLNVALGQDEVAVDFMPRYDSQTPRIAVKYLPPWCKHKTAHRVKAHSYGPFRRYQIGTHDIARTKG